MHLGILVQMLSALCEASYPFLVSKALEAALEASKTNVAAAGSFTLWQALLNPPPALVSVLALVVLNAIGETVFTSLRAICASLITISTLKRLRSTVFGALLQQEKLWFQRRGYDAASLASRVTSDCEAVAKIVSINFNVALRQGVQSIGSLCFLAYINPLIALYCTVSALFMAWMSLKCVFYLLCFRHGLHATGMLNCLVLFALMITHVIASFSRNEQGACTVYPVHTRAHLQVWNVHKGCN